MGNRAFEEDRLVRQSTRICRSSIENIRRNIDFSNTGNFDFCLILQNNNQLQTIPSEIYELKHLVKLDLR